MKLAFINEDEAIGNLKGTKGILKLVTIRNRILKDDSEIEFNSIDSLIESLKAFGPDALIVNEIEEATKLHLKQIGYTIYFGESGSIKDFLSGYLNSPTEVVSPVLSKSLILPADIEYANDIIDRYFYHGIDIKDNCLEFNDYQDDDDIGGS